MTIEQLQVMSFQELTEKALAVKVLIAKHYAGQKLPLTEFMQLKGVETIYNMRSWKEGDCKGPVALNKKATKLAKGN
jgi:hypothetical protein